MAKPTEAQKKAAGANGHVISLTVKSGNQIISDFNKGKATVMVELVSRLIGKIFKMYKFRSMYMDAEERKKELMAQNTMSDSKMFKMDFDPRVIGNKILPDGTKKKGIGQYIRDFSIDEFPQFFNVLKGDLSLVGTRPPLISEVDLPLPVPPMTPMVWPRFAVKLISVRLGAPAPA